MEPKQRPVGRLIDADECGGGQELGAQSVARLRDKGEELRDEPEPSPARELRQVTAHPRRPPPTAPLAHQLAVRLRHSPCELWRTSRWRERRQEARERATMKR